MGEARPTVIVDVVGDERIAGDLAAGGVFVPGCAVALHAECDLVVRQGVEEVRVAARVVFANAQGAGLQLVDAEAKSRILVLIGKRETETGSEEEEEAHVYVNMHERLRNLSIAEQVKIAQRGQVAERIVLERTYGKTVWEPLLRNPRLTPPEVARIARMGALPRPLLELILANGAWLQVPEVRRALLANPGLGTDQILRVLRLVPKHELKIAATQTAYPIAVRDCARRLMRGDEKA
jgi:hypothetical protein